MKILGVVPARGGSKGIKLKNIRPLASKPLIVYTLQTARECTLITDLVVSTDNEQIRKIALENGAQAPFLRPAELATDTALAVPTIQHAAGEMEQLKGIKYDYIIMLQPTTPLKTSRDLTEALNMLIESEADSVISVVDVDNWHPMKMKKIENGFLVDYQPPPVENPPRQLLPKVYMVNGAIYATRRDVLMNQGSFKGRKCLSYIMPPQRSVNIDTEADFVTAEYFLCRKKESSELKSLYEDVYKDGKEKFFSFDTLDVTKEVLSELDWKGLEVLEIGCGTGETASCIADAGADSVLAMDFSKNAIEIASAKHKKANLEFKEGTFEDIHDRFDCIVLQEVIEHTEDPFGVLSNLSRHIKNEGHIIVTCPSFINIRGIVWMTLKTLLDVPMSLTDKHFLCPFDMTQWAGQLGLKLKWRTFRHSLAHGEDMIIDMQRRLNNALGDAGLRNDKVDELLVWLKNISCFHSDQLFNGSKGIYHFFRED